MSKSTSIRQCSLRQGVQNGSRACYLCCFSWSLSRMHVVSPPPFRLGSLKTITLLSIQPERHICTVTIHRSHTWSLRSTTKRRYGGSVLVSVCDSFARSYVPQGWLGRYRSLTTYMVYTNTSTNFYCHLNKAPSWQVISDGDGHWLGTSFHLLQLLRI